MNIATSNFTLGGSITIPRIILTVTSILFFLVTFFAATQFVGSIGQYLCLSFLCWTLVVSAFRFKTSYSSMFLAVFLSLGFWLKLTEFSIFKKEMTESIGSFTFQSQAWNEILMVVNVAILAVILANFIAFKSFQKTTLRSQSMNFLPAPRLYLDYRDLFYSLFAIVFATTLFANVRFGIHQVGLTPKTVLVWPLNGLIAIAINYGFLFVLLTFLHWDRQSGLRIGKQLLFTVVCIFGCSISVLSRSVFVFQTLAIIFCLFFNRDFLKFKAQSFLFYVFLVGIMFFVSISIINNLRSTQYINVGNNVSARQKLLIRLEVLDGGIQSFNSKIKKEDTDTLQLGLLTKERAEILQQIDAKAAGTGEFTIKSNDSVSPERGSVALIEAIFSLKDSLLNVVALVSNRFVGLEGMMSVQSFEGRGYESFVSALFEKRSQGHASSYQEIAKTSYRYADTNVWQFASIPGATAFLYISDSLAVVFFGMLALALIAGALEHLAWFLTRGNAFIAAFVGVSAANSVAQFGVSPRSEVFYYFCMVVMLFAFYSLPFLSTRFRLGKV